VGLLDVDIHGPSIPTMLGLEHYTLGGSDGEIAPADVDGLKVISIGLFLPSPDDAVIWRGPLKMGAIKQFLKDVAWGDLDVLVIDSPPGTGDEPLSVCQLIGRLDGAVVVTTPQKVAATDVRKSISFCRQLHVPVLGVVENMSGFACPRCGEVTPIFRSGGGRQIADDMRVPFLGSIPVDPKIAEACDSGQAFVRRYAASPTATVMRAHPTGGRLGKNGSHVNGPGRQRAHPHSLGPVPGRMWVPLPSCHLPHAGAIAFLKFDSLLELFRPSTPSPGVP
jgi:ATP-binding protein involved in chromosome partitioning